MNSETYSVLYGECVLAQGMSLSMALLLIESLMQKYHQEKGLAYTVEREVENPKAFLLDITDLYVIDMESRKIHRVGDDPHDSLSVLNGEVRYFNVKNGDGGGVNDGGYRILETKDGCFEDEFGIIDKRFAKEISEYIERAL